MAKTIENKQFTLQGRDWAKGLLIAVLTAVLTVILQTAEAGSLAFDWKTIATTGITAGAAYILKNWVEPSKTVTIEKPAK